MYHSHTISIIVEISQLFLERNRPKERESFQWHVCRCMALCSSLFILTFVCMTPSVFASSPSFIQSSYCSVTAGRRAPRKGRDSCLESISLTPSTPASVLCQEAQNVGKRSFLCVGDAVGAVGSVLAHGGHRDWKRKGGLPSVSTDCLQGYTSACECLPEVSGSFWLVSLLWKCSQVPAGGSYSHVWFVCGYLEIYMHGFSYVDWVILLCFQPLVQHKWPNQYQFLY